MRCGLPRGWSWVIGLITQGVLLSSASSALADDAASEASPSFSLPRALSPFDYYVRFDALADLVERGISRSDHQPTGMATGVVAFGNFYILTSAYGLDNRPASAGYQAQGLVAVGYEKQFDKLIIDINASKEVARVNENSEGSAEINLSSRYALTNWFEFTSFLGYSPYDDRRQIISGGGGVRLRLSPDLNTFAQVGMVGYLDTNFDLTTDRYTFWQAGAAYRVNNNVSIGLTYEDSTLSKPECATLAESHSTHSCGASIIGRLSFKLYREDLEGRTLRSDAQIPASPSADSPPLDTLAEKFKKRRGDDDDVE